jgi:Transposase DDE domain group 1
VFFRLSLPCLVEHKVSELLRQRIGALSLGYEDLNDHDRLRLDPLHALIAAKADVLGEDRLCQEDRDKALAAHSTLNRLELGALGARSLSSSLAQGLSHEEISREQGVSLLAIGRWSKRWADKGLEGLKDLPTASPRGMRYAPWWKQRWLASIARTLLPTCDACAA